MTTKGTVMLSLPKHPRAKRKLHESQVDPKPSS